MSLHFGTVAGEPSGDLLMARVMQGVSSRVEAASFQGIGGPAMAEQGLQVWHSMQALSVFGYVDALKRLPTLVRTYHDVKRRWLASPPKVFVGVDAPDFNLRLELALRQAGIPTVHFVGPSIWAWRPERIHKIKAAVSHMLVLFPFEEELYQEAGVPVTYVGHPLAQAIPLNPDRERQCHKLGIDPEDKVLALLPGSRSSEIRLLAPVFLQAARLLQQRDPRLHVLVPVVDAARRAEFETCLRQYPVANLRILQQDGSLDRPVSWDALEAANAVLVASGTATLETALFKRPMVISYILSSAMRRIMAWKSGQSRPLLPWVGLPNVLLNDFIVPELLQEEAQPGALADAVWRALSDKVYADHIAAQFHELHISLSRDTARLAGDAILQLAGHDPV